MPYKELEKAYKKERDARVKERMRVILELYKNKKMTEITPIVERCYSSIMDWVHRWNKEGLNGLIPKFTGGPKPKITKDNWDKIINDIENKAMDINDVRIYVKKEYGVEYAYNGVWAILREKNKKGKRRVKYGKPYIQNNKRPKNAKAILKKT